MTDKNLTIGIDIRVLAKGTRTGIEEYVLNLLPRLFTLDKKVKYKLFYNAFNKVKLDYSWLNLKNVELKEFKFPNRCLDFFTQLFKKPKIDKLLGEIDIFFSPHFLPISLSKRCKRVITFHDLSFEHYPQFFSFSRKIWHFLTFPKQQARKADKIITDSFSTKEDLVKIYKVEPEKIKVIYLGVDERFKPLSKNLPQIEKVRKKYNLPPEFILYFGTIEPRKNIISIIKAFEILKEKLFEYRFKIDWHGFEGIVMGKEKNIYKDLKLVIAGAKGWLYKKVFEKAKNSKYKKDIVFTGAIDDEDKSYLYNLAKVFVYPSFFEGFGFPPLEAMACGIPTIVSNTSSLPEVVGKGALMVDPHNTSELVLALEQILKNQNLEEVLRKEGIKQAQKFDWNKTAQELLSIFYELSNR